MTSLDTTVTRDRNWWVAECTFHGKEYGTQARRLDQIEEMVKDAAALITGDSVSPLTSLSKPLNSQNIMSRITGEPMTRDITLVGVAGFEPTASSSRTKRATKLRHTPCFGNSIIIALRSRKS